MFDERLFRFGQSQTNSAKIRIFWPSAAFFNEIWVQNGPKKRFLENREKSLKRVKWTIFVPIFRFLPATRETLLAKDMFDERLFCFGQNLAKFSENSLLFGLLDPQKSKFTNQQGLKTNGNVERGLEDKEHRKEEMKWILRCITWVHENAWAKKGHFLEAWALLRAKTLWNVFKYSFYTYWPIFFWILQVKKSEVKTSSKFSRIMGFSAPKKWVKTVIFRKSWKEP